MGRDVVFRSDVVGSHVEGLVNKVCICYKTNGKNYSWTRGLSCGIVLLDTLLHFRCGCYGHRLGPSSRIGDAA
jgi:hypothetical protein